MTEYSTATGIGLSIEGPVSREKYGSFVMNYRYSAFNPLQYGLENALNLHQTTSEYKTAPIIQDVSFRLDLPSRQSNQISFFGLVSIAQQNIFGTDSLLSSNIHNYRNLQDELFRTNYFLGGISYKKAWGNNYRNYWKTTLGATYFTVNNLSETNDKNEKRIPTFSHENWNYSIKLNSTIHQHINPNWSIRSGILLDHTVYSFHDIYYQQIRQNPSELELDVHTTLLQAYTQVQYQPSPQLKTYIGFNSNLFLTHPAIRDIAIEPRLVLQWIIDEDHQIEFGYGMHSQKLPTTMLYHLVDTDNNGSSWQANIDIKTSTAHLIHLAYQWNFAERWRFKAGVYYQYKDQIVLDSLHPMINYTHYGSQYYNHELLNSRRLINRGNWHKIGGDLMLEKYFGDGYYGMIALSLVNSALVLLDAIAYAWS